MDSQTLAQTTVLYIVSTLAQTCGALVAFVGAIGLCQFGVLWGRSEEARKQLQQVREKSGVSRGIINAPRMNFLSTGESEFSDLDIFAKTQELQRYIDEEIAPRPRRSQRLFLLFLCADLGVIFLSFIGFLFVPSLATHPKAPYAFSWCPPS
jgi:hypothetical protein